MSDKEIVIEELEGLFASYSDFHIDPWLDAENKLVSEAMEARAKKPPKKGGAPKRRRKKEGEEPPAIAEEGDLQFIEEMWRLDPRIQKIQVQMIPPTPVNLEWAFWHEPNCRAMGQTIYASIVGEGVQINTKNDKIRKALDKFNREILVMDIIRDMVIDNIIHGESVFIKRAVKVEDVDTMKVFRIDMRTVRKIQHDFEGWRKWKQYAYVRASLPEKEKGFFDPKYDPMPMVDPNYQVYRGEKGMVHTTQLRDDEVLFFNLFRESPMMGILDMVIHKKWLVLFMRKTAQRFSTPVPVIRIGTPEYHPTSIDNYKKLLKSASKRASMWRNFDSWAIPFNWDLQLEQPRGTGIDFPSMIRFINNEIMMGLSGSISLFQNEGNALSTGGRTIEANFIRIVKGLRTKIDIGLRSLYDEYLILTGIVKTKEDLDKPRNEYGVQFTELHDERTKDLIDGIVSMHEKGITKDAVETRNLMRPYYPDLEDVDDMEEFMESQGAGAPNAGDNDPDALPDDDTLSELINGALDKRANGEKKPTKKKAKKPSKGEKKNGKGKK